MENIPDILKEENKEKFRRKLLIASRLIAVLLILALFWIGYAQVSYCKEVRKIMNENGELGYCYMCGKESLRKCECQYNHALTNVDYDILSNTTAHYNIRKCNDLNDDYIDLSKNLTH